MSIFDENRIRWCAEECARQESGELSVYRMIMAHNRAMEMYQAHFTQIITMDHVRELGYCVDPDMNRLSRLRETPVIKNNDGRVIGLPPDQVEDAVYRLLGMQKEITPDEFYHEYESIHPHRDGNGRVGAIFWNWLNGTLFAPVTPPEYGSQVTMP